MNGVPCVMTTGLPMRPALSAGSWDSQVQSTDLYHESLLLAFIQDYIHVHVFIFFATLLGISYMCDLYVYMHISCVPINVPVQRLSRLNKAYMCICR